METKIKILHLEDNPNDAELVKEILDSESVGFEILQVSNRESYVKAVQTQKFDLIFSDYSIPSFSGAKALEIAKENTPDTPFIYISGTIGEDAAIEGFKNGATDYVLKNRLSKLIPSVLRALREKQERIQRKMAEIEIHRQATLINIVPDAIQELDLEGNILFWSKGSERIYGWTAEETLGRNIKDIAFKKDPSLFSTTVKSVLEKGEWFGELKQVNKANREIIVESRQALIKGEPSFLQTLLVVNTDITEKKKLEAQFLRAQRMECIGALATGIAHDLNNVLAPIMMFIQILKKRLPDERSQKLLNMLEDSSQRGADLVKQVLSFGRGLESQRIAIQISHLVSEVEKVIRETFPKNINPVISIKKDIWSVLADTTQIHQVLMNLCVNARDAMPNGGTLFISVDNLFIDENYAQISEEAKIGHYVVVEVADTGEGMSTDTMTKIYEPFFTTKEIGKGTGLGLPTVISIVKGHDGFITLESKLKQGTRFKVHLPASEVKETLVVEKEPYDLFAGQGEMILVVDDEISVREITKASLEASNYEVLTANDGTEAIANYLQEKEKISLVITDNIMPFMDGLTTIKALRKIDPTIKVILASGVSMTNVVNDETYNINGVLQKPYTTEKLLKLVKEVLSQ